jgi:hypothetical protein
MLGLEHAAALTFEALGPASDPRTFFEVLSRGPARIAQLRASDTRVRHSAHGAAMVGVTTRTSRSLTRDRRWSVDRNTLESRSMNTPYDGRAMVGRVRATIAKGRSSSIEVCSRDRANPPYSCSKTAPPSRATPPGIFPTRASRAVSSSSTPPSRATKRSSPTPVTPDRSSVHVPAHRQLRRHATRRRVVATVVPGVVMRELSHVPSNWRSVGPLEVSRASAPCRGNRGRRHSSADPSPALARRVAGRLRPRRSRGRRRGGANGAWYRRAPTWSAGSRRASPTSRGAGDLHVVALDYGIKTTMVNQLAERFRVSVVPARPAPRRFVRYDPTASSCPTAR